MAAGQCRVTYPVACPGAVRPSDPGGDAAAPVGPPRACERAAGPTSASPSARDRSDIRPSWRSRPLPSRRRDTPLPEHRPAPTQPDAYGDSSPPPPDACGPTPTAGPPPRSRAPPPTPDAPTTARRPGKFALRAQRAAPGGGGGRGRGGEGRPGRGAPGRLRDPDGREVSDASVAPTSRGDPAVGADPNGGLGRAPSAASATDARRPGATRPSGPVSSAAAPEGTAR